MYVCKQYIFWHTAPIWTCYIKSALCVTFGWECSAAHCLALNNSGMQQYRNAFMMEALSTQWRTWMGSTQVELKEFLNLAQLPACVCVCILMCVCGSINMFVRVCVLCILTVSLGSWIESCQQVKPVHTPLTKTVCVYVCVFRSVMWR